MQLIANTRMYGVGERCRRLWNELVTHISDDSGVPLDILEHAAPSPMADLWNRPDMGLVQMCGWPFWRAKPQPSLVAAPVPATGGAAFASDPARMFLATKQVRAAVKAGSGHAKA